MERSRRIPAFGVRPVHGAQTHIPAPTMNTTPLIDVMLVLLIMFIVTIPIASQKVPLDLPQGTPPPSTGEPEVHRLTIDAAGALSWDGQAVTDADLPALLAAVKAKENAVLHLRADGETRYERYDQVLAAVKRAGIARLGMVGNEAFARSAG